MVLLVTTLLSLVTMFDTVRNNSPDALELKCIEVSFENFSHTRITKPITFLGLAALLYVFRFLGPNGILYRSVWHPI